MISIIHGTCTCKLEIFSKVGSQSKERYQVMHQLHKEQTDSPRSCLVVSISVRPAPDER
ncbi:hypothetical protein DPMN_052162 [Dreissena polymorpha]|uniref:Uncharacterized protein n=1 Tax=Dreissena polymorpha TaxID=45954 RepID=A0A9D4CJY8_DREPO|nr:hypothetical protein DPMN_052162 [Dreissena polymorpha]